MGLVEDELDARGIFMAAEMRVGRGAFGTSGQLLTVLGGIKGGASLLIIRNSK